MTYLPDPDYSKDTIALYHGTTLSAAEEITSFGIDFDKCKPLSDFGKGFYTTTYVDQAKNWAMSKRNGVVLQMVVSRGWLGTLSSLVYLGDMRRSGWQDFVRYCRSGKRSHKPNGSNYDVVYGAVAAWKPFMFRLDSVVPVFENHDQVSFHTLVCQDAHGPLLGSSEIVWSYDA